MAPGSVHLGCGAGFGGERADPAITVAAALAARPGPRYLIFELLAERTLAQAQLERRRDPARGYAPRTAAFLRPVLARCHRAGIVIVTNAGAANPAAAGRLVRSLARELGLPGLRVAVVEGDDLLGVVDEATIRSWPVVEGLPMGNRRLIAANVYLGAEPVARALRLGADVVITGRIVDSALVLGPLMHEFGWPATDYDRLAAGTMAGHLLECGPQITGGYFADPGFKDVPGLADVGFPIADVAPDGTMAITKAEPSGGMVTTRTVTEQLLYEVHDPAAYLVPDVTADITGARVRPDGPDRVLIHGVRGRPGPSTLKATVSVEGDWLAEGEISYAGPNALARAELAAAILRERVSQRWPGLPARIDIIGVASVLDGDDGALRARAGWDDHDRDLRVRLAVSAPDRETAEDVAVEVTSLYTAGPAGGAGARQAVTRRVRTASVLVGRDVPEVRVSLASAEEDTGA